MSQEALTGLHEFFQSVVDEMQNARGGKPPTPKMLAETAGMSIDEAKEVLDTLKPKQRKAKAAQLKSENAASDGPGTNDQGETSDAHDQGKASDAPTNDEGKAINAHDVKPEQPEPSVGALAVLPEPIPDSQWGGCRRKDTDETLLLGQQTPRYMEDDEGDKSPGMDPQVPVDGNMLMVMLADAA